MMTGVLMFVVYTAVVSVARWFNEDKRRQQELCYRILQEKRGGQMIESPVGSLSHLIFGREMPMYRLESGGLLLEVSTFPKMGTRIEISGDLPRDIKIASEGNTAGFRKFFGLEDPEMGQSAFDDIALLEGEHSQLLSYLHRDARRATLSALERGATLDNGVIRLQLDQNVQKPAELDAHIKVLMDMATHLRRGETGQAGRLIHVINTDTHKTVRENCLSALYRDHADLPMTQELTRRLLADRSASIRFMAARHMGEKGINTLEELVMRTSTPAEVRMDALLLLVQRCRDRERVHRSLEGALHGADPVVATALEVALSQDIVLGEKLLNRLARSNTPRLLKALAEYCVVIPNRNSMERVASLLSHSDSAVVCAASDSLGQFGTSDFVPHLMAAKKRQPKSVQDVVDSAILSIQARVSPALAGGLSLGQAHTHGGLSVHGQKADHETPE